MKRQKVNSSNIQSVGYDAQRKVLEIEFKNGVYHYTGVAPFIYKKLLSAKSAGKFFHQHINKIFDFKKGEYKEVIMPNIYICGKAGAGKTYAAKYLMEHYGYVQAKFAYPVYDIARNYFGMKEKDRNLLQIIGTDCGRAKEYENIWVDRFCEDLRIVQRSREKLGLSKNNFIVDDCRFANEHEALKKCGWVGIYLDVSDEIREKRLAKRDGTSQKETLQHSSETSVDGFKDQLVKIDSSQTLEKTYRQLSDLIHDIRAEEVIK